MTSTFKVNSSYVTGLLLGIGLIFSPASSLNAQVDVTRIEEHWELEITEADSQTNAPQLLMHFSPFGADVDAHFELDLNHASMPNYSAGGFQVRAMQGERLVSEARQMQDVRLNSTSETLTWVQIAQKMPEGWAFAIGFGNSQSWGGFGGPNTIVTLAGVNQPLQYSPLDSLKNSGVVFAKNRVDRLTLRKIRYYYSNNQYRDLAVDASVQ